MKKFYITLLNNNGNFRATEVARPYHSYTKKTMRTLIIKSTLALLFSTTIALTAGAQLSAPFAGGVLLQQGGGTNPAFGLGMKAKQTYTGNVILSWAQPTQNGVLKLSGFGAGAGDISMSALDLTADVGTSILPIANGGTNTNSALSG